MKYLSKAIQWWVGLFNPMTIVVWFIGAIIATGATTAYYAVRPPGTLLSLAEDTESSISDDGKLILLVHLDRHRFCPATTNRWLMHYADVNGKQVPIWRWIGPIPTPPTDLGAQVFGLELDIPTQWDAKGTFYASRTDYACGLLTSVFNPDPAQTGPLPIDEHGAAGKP